jgi:hypothetical protein
MRKKRCTYCANDATTSDHIPPECFFAKPRPDNLNLITVPACASCNNSFGEDDGYARNLLVSLVDSEGHPDVIRDLRGRLGRSLARDQKLFKRTLLSLSKTEVRTEAGLYLGTAHTFNLDQPQFDRFFKRLARGLLFHCTGTTLADGLIEWRTVPGANMAGLARELEAIPPSYEETIGDRVFEYLGFVLDPQRVASLWVVRFYAGPVFLMRLDPALLVAN